MKSLSELKVELREQVLGTKLIPVLRASKLSSDAIKAVRDTSEIGFGYGFDASNELWLERCRTLALLLEFISDFDMKKGKEKISPQEALDQIKEKSNQALEEYKTWIVA